MILREDDTGRTTEPYERVLVQCDTDYAGAVIERIGKHGELTAMEEDGPGRTRMEFRAPTRGLIGYRSEFLTAHARHRGHLVGVRRLRPLARAPSRAAATA